MRTSFVDGPKFWRARAFEARAVAARMSDELSRTAMLALAARYDRLANRVSTRSGQPQRAINHGEGTDGT